MAPAYEWHKIADDAAGIAFMPNNMTAVTVNGRTIGIGRYQDKLFAFANTCPHAGGLLTDGRIDGGGNVICPLHGYRFNMANGRNTSGEGYHIKHWPVDIRADGIFVGLEKGGLFSRW